MTGPELASARRSLGYSINEMAKALRLGPNGATSIREMERGKRPITGPISVAIELLLANPSQGNGEDHE